MATTDFGALSALQKTIYTLKTFKQGRDDSFFGSNGFMGESSSDGSKPIHMVEELTETERGTEAVLPMRADLTGGGVVGDNQLDDNEEALNVDSQTIRVDQLRNGVKSRGRMAEQSTVLRFRTEAKDALAFWLSDIYDELTFLTAAGRAYSLNTDGSTRAASQLPQLSFAADVAAASTNRIMYAGSATSEATLTAADTMNWNLVIQAKAFAKRKRLRPVRAGGRSFYILVLSTEQCRDLEQSPDYKSLTAQALPRGLDNPLFNNAKKIVGDVVIHDHQKVYNTLGLSSGSRWGSGSTVHGAQAMLMGAQAIGLAQLSGKSAGWSEGDKTDHGNKSAIGIGRMFGLLKPQFKSRYDNQAREDFGIVSIKTAAATS